MANLITIGEVLDTTIDHYKKHAKELLGISLFLVLASVPNAIAQVISPPMADTSWSALAIAALVLELVGIVSTVVVGIWINITLILAINEQQIEKKTIDPMVIGKKSWGFFIPVIIAALITLAITIIASLLWTPGLALIILSAANKVPAAASIAGTILLFAGALASLLATIYVSTVLTFTSYFIVLQKKTGTTGLIASYKLVKGRFFATLLRSALPKFIFSLALFVISFLMIMAATVMSITFSGSAPLLLLGSGVWSLLTVAISTVFIPIPLIIDYYVYDSLSKNK